MNQIIDLETRQRIIIAAVKNAKNAIGAQKPIAEDKAAKVPERFQRRICK